MRRKQGNIFPVLTAVLLICAMLPVGLFSAVALPVEYLTSEAYENSIYKTELEEFPLTDDNVSDLVRAAISQQGYHEGDSELELSGLNRAGTGNYTEYGWWLSRVTGSTAALRGDWSTAFLCWCARQAGVGATVLPTVTSAAALRSFLVFIPADGFIPAQGDVVFFNDGNGGLSGHVGLVISSTIYEVMTVEGDVNGEVKVCEYFYEDGALLGYGRPAYVRTEEGLAASSSTTTAPLTVEQLRKKFPAGKYWNGGNPDKYTSTPCSHHKTTGCSYYGGCFCNVFYNSISNCIQCQGFSMKMGYDAYGINPYLWQQDTDPAALTRLKPGDIIRYKNNGHTIFVLGVKDNIITYADCNNDSRCVIRWDATVTIEKVRSTFSYVRVAPYALNSNGLAVQFNANGGTVPGSEKQTVYTVVNADGLNMRSGAGTGYKVLTRLPKNARFLVTATASGSGYTWGKLTYGGVTGWVVISVSSWVTKATSRITDYYVGAAGTVYTSVDSAIAFQSFKYGTTYKEGLHSVADFGIVNSGSEFLGWSKTQTGTDVIKAKTSLTADKIQPASSTGGQTVVLYAVWRTLAPEVGTFTPSAASASVGDTVKFTLACSNATKYDIKITSGTKTVASVTGSKNNYLSFKFTDAGTYTVSGTAYNSNGSTAAKSITYTVTPPTYAIRFAPNGGEIAGGSNAVNVYTVTAAAGLKLRSLAGTTSNAVILTVMPCGATFTGTETKDTGTLLWVKANYNGTEGWAAFYNKTTKEYNATSSSQPRYFVDDSVICDSRTGTAYSVSFTYGVINKSGLPDASLFGLERENYVFKGWSLAADGGTVYAPNTSLKINLTGVKTAVLYAVWEKEYAPGDINGDGTVNAKDLTLLRSFFANYNYDGESGAGDGSPEDVNGDGKVNSVDLSLLRKYIANYDYSTGTSSVVLG